MLVSASCLRVTLTKVTSLKTEPEESGAEEALPVAEAPSFADELAELGEGVLPGPLAAALLKAGFSALTSVQKAVIEADTEARDLRITSQTGSGKTVAVGLAIGRKLLLEGPRSSQDHEGAFDARAPQVLLLTPTRELAGQVRRELAWLFAEVPDAFVEVVTGGTSVGLERKSLSRGPRMIVGTPGRVLDHLNNGGFKGDHVTQVILDEADQMFDMGFREELTGILEQLPASRRTHLVSATFSGEVKRIAERHQTRPVFLEGSPLGAANADIEHVVHLVSFRHRYDALINILLRAYAERGDDSAGRTLVFTRTRADALEVAERLQRDGVRAEPLSGDLAQAQRTRTLSAFRSGSLTTLVATDVAARGLDVQGVDLVIHLDPPENSDTYTHRSGRTGRAGQKGTSVLLLPPQARSRIERMLKTARISPAWAPVPNADKVRKLFTKLGRRRLYAALEAEAPSEQLEYARKLLTEHAPEQIIARLLPMADVLPPCPPREITEHISPQHGTERRREERSRPGQRRPPGGPGRGGPKVREREESRPSAGAPSGATRFRPQKPKRKFR